MLNNLSAGSLRVLAFVNVIFEVKLRKGTEIDANCAELSLAIRLTIITSNFLVLGEVLTYVCVRAHSFYDTIL